MTINTPERQPLITTEENSSGKFTRDERATRKAKEKGKAYVEKEAERLYQSSSSKQSLPISFTKDEYKYIIWPHRDPLIVNPVIGENKIRRLIVDGGSSVNILYYRTYCKMNLGGGEQLEPYHEISLYHFRNQPISIEGTIKLHVLLGKASYTIEREAKFYVVRGG